MIIIHFAENRNEKITLHDLKMQQNRKESEDYSSKTSRRNDSDNGILYSFLFGNL